MTNKDNNHNNEKDHDKDHHSGKQGFASMDKEKVKEIASKGGQTSHKGENHEDDDNDHRKSKSHDREDDSDDEKDNRGRNKHDNDHDEDHHSGKQGFASMPKEQVREIASKGGQASHKNDNNNDKDEDK